MPTMTPDQLKQFRKGAGMSQAELAKEIGMARETIGQMERGQAPIEARTLLAMHGIIKDSYSIAQTIYGDYGVIRTTMRRTTGMRLNGSSILFGVFRRRDHAYRWATALARSAHPRPTREEQRRKAAAAGE